MPLNATTLSSALRSAMLAKPDLNAVDNNALTQLCDAIATTVVAHIQANATVPAGIAVATTGTAAAQTGATTAPGTVT